MLLEVSCTTSEFNEFLSRAEEAGIVPSFDMHGADEYSSFHVEGQKPDEDIVPDTHVDSSSLGNEEIIGKPSRNGYEVGDLFISDGIMYKATTVIYPNQVLVVGGNCETTTLNDELKLLK